MAQARVVSVVQVVEPLWALAILEIDGVCLWARVDCDFDEYDLPLVSEGDILSVKFEWDGFPERLQPAVTETIGVQGEHEHTVLTGRVTQLVDPRDFVLDCGAFQVHVDLLRGNRPEWIRIGTLVQIHVGTTVVAEVDEASDNR